MAGGIYDSRDFKQIQLKMAEVKYFLTYIHSSQNVLELNLAKGYYKKNVAVNDCSIKK